MLEEKKLEGWVPELGEDMTLAQVIELAFDYRGNTTVMKSDGTDVVGYLFNRNVNVQEPFIQMFDASGHGPLKIRYSEIENIKFTGKDTAAGKSWEAWVKRKENEKAIDFWDAIEGASSRFQPLKTRADDPARSGRAQCLRHLVPQPDRDRPVDGNLRRLRRIAGPGDG